MKESRGGHFGKLMLQLLQYYNYLARGDIARYDVILDQSERSHLYNHLSNYTKEESVITTLICTVISVPKNV